MDKVYRMGRIMNLEDLRATKDCVWKCATCRELERCSDSLGERTGEMTRLFEMGEG